MIIHFVTFLSLFFRTVRTIYIGKSATELMPGYGPPDRAGSHLSSVYLIIMVAIGWSTYLDMDILPVLCSLWNPAFLSCDSCHVITLF